jgi:hypothetical protein
LQPVGETYLVITFGVFVLIKFCPFRNGLLGRLLPSVEGARGGTRQLYEELLLVRVEATGGNGILGALVSTRALIKATNVLGRRNPDSCTWIPLVSHTPSSRHG